MRRFPWRQALTAGLGLIHAHPRAVLLWMLIAFARELAFSGLSAAMFALMNAPRTAAWASSGAGEIAYAALEFLIPEGFSAVLIAAAFRALLKPADSRARFLRLGATELLMLGLILIASLAALVLGLVATFTVGGITNTLGHPQLIGTVAFVAALIAVLALIRFAPAPAILVDRGRIGLLAAWKASRGAYLPLLLILTPALLLQEIARGLPRQLLPLWRSLPWDGAARLGMDLWVGAVDVLFLAFGAGVIAVVYRRGAQTQD